MNYPLFRAFFFFIFSVFFVGASFPLSAKSCIQINDCNCIQANDYNSCMASYKQLLNTRTRTDLINYLIQKNNYKTYLEIGVADGSNFKNINVAHKDGIDPGYVNITNLYQMTSDEFFQQNDQFYDIIFIDGLHLSEQALKDVENSLKWINKGGVIVMHDCLPQSFEQQLPYIIPGSWNGDVWKTAAYIRMNFSDVHFCVLDMDWGCGILTPYSSQDLYPSVPMNDLDWNFYVNNRNTLLNVMQVETWINK